MGHTSDWGRLLAALGALAALSSRGLAGERLIPQARLRPALGAVIGIGIWRLLEIDRAAQSMAADARTGEIDFISYHAGLRLGRLVSRRRRPSPCSWASIAGVLREIDLRKGVAGMRDQARLGLHEPDSPRRALRRGGVQRTRRSDRGAWRDAQRPRGLSTAATVARAASSAPARCWPEARSISAPRGAGGLGARPGSTAWPSPAEGAAFPAPRTPTRNKDSRPRRSSSARSSRSPARCGPWASRSRE